MKKIYEIAAHVEAKYPDSSEDELLKKLTYRVEKDADAYKEVLAAVLTPIVHRMVLRQKNGGKTFTRQSTAKADREVERLVGKLIKNVKVTIMDTLRMPDGRLFADVQWYELDELERGHSAWSGLIKDIKNHTVVTKLTSTVRQNVKSDVLDKFAKARKLVPEKKARAA